MLPTRWQIAASLSLAALPLAAPAQIPAAQTPAAVQTEREAREECSFVAGGQSGMRMCLAAKATASAAQLAKAEQRLSAAISTWQEDPRFRVAARARLTAASRAFVQYRAAQCAFAYALGGGAIGNALEMGRLACVYELNARRADELDRHTADFSPR